MQKNSKYLELSLRNKWISLTKLWLSDNAPCSREKMFLELCPILPKAVRLNGKRIASADTLLVAAFRRIYGTSNIPEIIEKPPGSQMTKHNFEVHPAAALFPMMSDEEYRGLKESILENGILEPIVLYKGLLLDGRNRLRAAEELHRTVQIDELDEDVDPWGFVLAHNLHRRHLTVAQRSMIAAKIATLKNGQRKSGARSNDLAQADAAKLLNVSEPSVKRAKQIVEHGSQDLIQDVESGKVNLNQAVKAISPNGRTKDRPKANEAPTRKPRHDGEHNQSEVFALSTADVAITQLKGIPTSNRFRKDALQRAMQWINRELQKAT